MELHELRLGIKMPKEFSVGICEHVLMTSMKNFQCNISRPNDGKTKIVEKDLALSYDIFEDVFQHHMVNGLPSAGMISDWVIESMSERAFLCAPLICEILMKAYTSIDSSNIIKAADFPIWARSLRAAFPKWISNNVTWDSYPIGSYHLVNINVIRQFTDPCS